MSEREPPKTKDWGVISVLLFLSLIPVGAAIYRLSTLIIGVEIVPENTRFFDAPLPIYAHVLGAIYFGIAGPFQFSRRIRQQHLWWHKLSGRLLVIAGLAISLSSLYMAQFFDLPPKDGLIVYVSRLLVGFGMTFFLCLGVVAAIRKNIGPHRRSMIRAYALAMGAATQSLMGATYLLIWREQPPYLTNEIMMASGWVINILIAEFVIRRQHEQRAEVM